MTLFSRLILRTSDADLLEDIAARTTWALMDGRSQLLCGISRGALGLALVPQALITRLVWRDAVKNSIPTGGNR